MGDLSLKALSDGITGAKHTLADAINKTVTENGTFAQTEAKFNAHITDNTAHGLGTHLKDKQMHLGGLCQFVNGVDLNTLCIDTGFFMGSGMKNAPGAGWYYIEVLVHRNDSSGWCLQRLTDFNDSRYVYTRERRNGTWDTNWFCLFQYANDGKTSVANVIGSPSVATETFAQLSTDIQNLKNGFANYLNNKGQPSNGTDTLNNLIWRVSQINTGKRVITGRNSYSSETGENYHTAKIDLPFTPQLVFANYNHWQDYSQGSYGSYAVWKTGKDYDYNTYKTGGSDTDNIVTIVDNGISLGILGQAGYRGGTTYTWLVTE